mmetsp:Transcript_4517/g.5767  ORF Transcript_4517/g.5767 Transcript_4517/m.5767 type:complete len:121 (-) Transcript_4517:335-697(-)
MKSSMKNQELSQNNEEDVDDDEEEDDEDDPEAEEEEDEDFSSSIRTRLIDFDNRNIGKEDEAEEDEEFAAEEDDEGEGGEITFDSLKDEFGVDCVDCGLLSENKEEKEDVFEPIVLFFMT